MHNPLLMHVLQGSSNLAYVLPNSLLREAYILLNVTLHHKLQISFFRPFDCNKELIQLVIDKPVQVLDDVGVI